MNETGNEVDICVIKVAFRSVMMNGWQSTKSLRLLEMKLVVLGNARN